MDEFMRARKRLDHGDDSRVSVVFFKKAEELKHIRSQSEQSYSSESVCSSSEHTNKTSSVEDAELECCKNGTDQSKRDTMMRST